MNAALSMALTNTTGTAPWVFTTIWCSCITDMIIKSQPICNRFQQSYHCFASCKSRCYCGCYYRGSATGCYHNSFRSHLCSSAKKIWIWDLWWSPYLSGWISRCHGLCYHPIHRYIIQYRWAVISFSFKTHKSWLVFIFQDLKHYTRQRNPALPSLHLLQRYPLLISSVQPNQTLFQTSYIDWTVPWRRNLLLRMRMWFQVLLSTRQWLETPPRSCLPLNKHQRVGRDGRD